MTKVKLTKTVWLLLIEMNVMDAVLNYIARYIAMASYSKVAILILTFRYLASYL